MDIFQRNVAYIKLCNSAKHYCVMDIASRVLKHPSFMICSGSGSPNSHHYGDYGLLIHTEEVVRLCETVNIATGKQVDAERLFLSSLFHDIDETLPYIWGI